MKREVRSEANEREKIKTILKISLFNWGGPVGITNGSLLRLLLNLSTLS